MARYRFPCSLFRMVGAGILGLAACMVPGHPHMAEGSAILASLQLSRHVVAPGTPQIVTVRAASRSVVHLAVSFPNESLMVQDLHVPSSGIGHWTFLQPPNSITRSTRRATVAASIKRSSIKLSARYTVGYGPLDIVVPLGGVDADARMPLWIHTVPHAHVSARILQDTRRVMMASGTSGANGWLEVPFHAPIPVRRASLITVNARAPVRDKTVTSHASFVVRPFQFRVELVDPQVLHWVKGVWRPTTHVRLGEAVRFGGRPVGFAPAGRLAVCVRGTVTVTGGAHVLTLGCTAAARGGPAVWAQARFTTSADLGTHIARIHVAWETGQAAYILPFSVNRH